MGFSAKWLRSLVGIRKHEKDQYPENDKNNSLSSNKHGQKKTSVTTPEAVFAPGTAVSTGDTIIQSDSHSASSPATLNNRLITCQTQEKTREEWAATVIQTAFRAFLEGWCDIVGSVEEIQAKLLKRQEAAAKRERAMAYALTHQWQAGSRKPAAPTGFEPDKNNWGWHWLERWMAVRPWENRFLDINLKDGVKLNEDGTTEGKNAVSTSMTPSKATGRKPISTLQSNSLNHKSIPPMSEGSGSLSTRSASLMTSSALRSSKPKQKPSDEAYGEVTSRVSAIGSRSYSNPKERTSQLESQARRLSLPNSGLGVGKQASYKVAINQSANKKPLKDAQKSEREDNEIPTNPSSETKDVET